MNVTRHTAANIARVLSDKLESENLVFQHFSLGLMKDTSSTVSVDIPHTKVKNCTLHEHIKL